MYTVSGLDIRFNTIVVDGELANQKEVEVMVEAVRNFRVEKAAEGPSGLFENPILGISTQDSPAELWEGYTTE